MEDLVRRIAFSRAVLIASIALVVAACSPADGGAGTVDATLPVDTTVPLECEAREADGNLHIYHRESRMPTTLLDRFEEELGVRVIEDFYDSNESLHAKLQSGASYDVVIATDHVVERLVDEGYLSRLDRRLLPNFANLGAAFEEPVFDSGSAHSAAFQWGTTGLAINNALVSQESPISWAVFFDSAIESPGGLALLDNAREAMAGALRHLRHSVNTTDESELAAAADLIADSRDRSVRFRDEGQMDALISGELAVAQIRGGDFLAGLDDEDDRSAVSFVFPAEGGTLWVDSMTIPLAAESRCTAHAFINFILDLENAAELANWGRHASPNAAAQGLISPNLVANQVLYPGADLTDSLDRLRYTGPLEPAYTEYFQLGRG